MPTDTTTPEAAEKAEVVDDGPAAHQPALPAPRPASGPTAAAVAPIGLFGDVSPAAMIEKATEHARALTKVLEDKQLYKAIGGNDRRHVLVDGWTLLGAMVGVFSTTVWTRQIADPEGGWHPPITQLQTRTLHSKWCKVDGGTGPAKPGCDTYEREVPVVVTAGAGGWEARVEAHTLDGRLVGAAEAECRWDEPNWTDRDSYALRSMAQTRATSKALRMPLGFIVELAGFKATPAEELDGLEVRGEAAEADAYTGPVCPVCGSALWDNRASNDVREAEGKRRQPEWKCRNRQCRGGRDGTGDKPEPFFSWEANYFDVPDYTNAAKRYVVELVTAERDRWLDRYGSVEGHPRQEAITTALTGDDAQRAGVLYLDVLDKLTSLEVPDADLGADLKMSAETRDLVCAWAYTALRRPLEDLFEIPSDEVEQPPTPEAPPAGGDDDYPFSDYG